MYDPSRSEPFRPVDLTIEYADAAAGARKTLTAVAVALKRAKEANVKTMFAMPTLELIREMAEFARRDGTVPVVEITSGNDYVFRRKSSVVDLIHQHMTGVDPKGNLIPNHITGGHLLFITHEALNRIVAYPPEASEFELVIDEAYEVILTRKPFRLRDSYWVLTSFLDVFPAKVSPHEMRVRQAACARGVPVYTAAQAKRDARWMATLRALVDPNSNASPGEIENAKAQIARIERRQVEAKAFADEPDKPLPPYYMVSAKAADLRNPSSDPWAWIARRIDMERFDDIYQYVAPIPHWLLQEAPLFTDRIAWDQMINRKWGAPSRGLITICGFRRPDALKAFRRVTMMSALFQHTMVYAVWSQLGVTFEPSSLINLTTSTTTLGKRRLRIFWLTPFGWSKTARDKAGGLKVILDVIANSGAIASDAPVCVLVNKDDGGEDNPSLVRKFFRNAIMMPHNSRGQNRFRPYHQLIHTAALNSYTPDIRWIEVALGIDAKTQRIARLGQEVYQTMMRLSLREPTSGQDVTLVCMDRDVAEWLPQWFVPRDQVEVIEIDTSSVIRPKAKTGRPRMGDEPMTGAERMRMLRARRREERQAQ